MRWEGSELIIDINERCAPLPYALRGSVTFSPGAFYDSPVELAATGNHFWQAAAPHGRVTAEFSSPKLSWSGAAYHDMNWGDEPLESAFRSWTWLRALTGQGVEVIYDVERRNGSRLDDSTRGNCRHGWPEFRDWKCSRSRLNAITASISTTST